jgi:hypothetical protein
MRLVVGLLAAAIAAAACGDDAATTAPVSVATSAPRSTAAASTAPPSTTPGDPAGIAGLVTGRGDDGSIEVTVWAAGGPGRIVVAFDSDSSHGDPASPVPPEAEAMVRITDGAVSGVEAGGAVLTGAALDGVHAVSGADGPHTVVRLFLLADLVPRSGSVWVWVDGGSVAFGADLGSACDAATAEQPPGVGPACREASPG